MFGRIEYTVHFQVTMLGVVEQCCQMVKYFTIFYKNVVILHACV